MDRDKELDRICEYIHDLQKINMVYVPVENDKIDRQLAEKINGSSMKKPLMLFVREQEGVYTYCKKKVLIKNEKKGLVIRVGGGYMSLEEFIDSFNLFQIWKTKHTRH